GKRLVIAGPGRNSPSQLKIISLEGAELKQLLPEEWGRINEVAWTPDGQSILFTIGRELWQISASGGRPRKILTSATGIWRSLRVHPDGRRIAFHARKVSQEFWIMDNFLPAQK
ncbi:MAG: TolB family protein, partial [Sedimentisphaerales bacterium]